MHEAIVAFKTAMVADLGYAPEIIVPGRIHRFPTKDRLGDDAGWCRLFDDGRGGVYGDHRSNRSFKWQATHNDGGKPGKLASYQRRVALDHQRHREAQRAKWVVNARYNNRLWRESRPIERGDPAATYLAERGFADVWPLPVCLRLHPRLRYTEPNGVITFHPAMVALLTAPGGEVIAVHRTYITTNGQKASVTTPKKLTPANGPVVGPSILLTTETTGTIGIAEGIETSLAATLLSAVPTVAAYCANNLATWGWPSGVKRIVIFGDNDVVGRNAAMTLARRAEAARVDCEIVIPSPQGFDWADVHATQFASGGAA